MASTTLVITHGSEETQTIKDLLKQGSSEDREGLVRLASYFRAVASGNRNASVQIGTGDSAAAAAAGTVACVQASITAGDILYVGRVGFVATNGAVTPGDATFDMRTSDTAVGASVAAQVNAHASLTGVLTATAASGTVTITATVPGLTGNNITLAKVDANNAALILNGLADTVHQSTLLGGTGGTDSAVQTYAVGK